MQFRRLSKKYEFVFIKGKSDEIKQILPDEDPTSDYTFYLFSTKVGNTGGEYLGKVLVTSNTIDFDSILIPLSVQDYIKILNKVTEMVCNRGAKDLTLMYGRNKELKAAAIRCGYTAASEGKAHYVKDIL